MSWLDSILNIFRRKVVYIRRDLAIQDAGSAEIFVHCYKILAVDYKLIWVGPPLPPSCAPPPTPEVEVDIIQKFGQPALKIIWTDIQPAAQLKIEVKCLA